MTTERYSMREMEQRSLIDALVWRIHRVLGELEVEDQEAFLRKVLTGVLTRTSPPVSLESWPLKAEEMCAQEFVNQAFKVIQGFTKSPEEEDFVTGELLMRIVGELVQEYQRPYRLLFEEERRRLLGGKPMDELPEQEWRERHAAMEQLAETIRKGGIHETV